MLEQWDNMTFGHCDVYKWTVSVAKKLKEAWELIMGLHGGPIYAIHDRWDDKHRKWCRLFGFVYFSDLECQDGITRSIYIRRLGNGITLW